MFTMLSGTRNFQAKFISRSTRIRGSVARTQNIRKMKNSTFPMNTPSRITSARRMLNGGAARRHVGGERTNGSGSPPPRNSTVARQLIAKMLRYSPRKNRPNLMLEYSVWKPAMISDSASGRSNGVRFTSAMLAISRIRNARKPGGDRMNQPKSTCWLKMVTRLRLPVQSTIGTIESTWGISYETSWATARMAPSSEYLLRLDQPARKIPRGLMLETATR